jgi:1,4-alpha-glucan branching enzyme
MLLFMGAEMAQPQEWNHDSQIEWQLLQKPKHAGIQACIRDLNKLVADHPALHERDFNSDGFEWISGDDAANCVYAYARFSADRSEKLVVVLNMTPVPRHGYRIGVPELGFYQEIFCSDAKKYGGGDVGNGGGVESQPIPQHGRAQSINITLPPLGIAVFKAGPSKLPAGTKK